MWGNAILAFNTQQQYRQCAYNVIMRNVHETIVAVEKQYVLHISVCVCVCVCVCVAGDKCIGAGVCLHKCSLTYPACNVPSNLHLRPFWLHYIFPHYFIKGTIFRKGWGEERVRNIKRVFNFLYDLYSKHFSF